MGKKSRMTICVIAKKDGKVYLAADSLTTYGDTKLVRMQNKSKLFPFTHFVVGMAGNGPLPQVLEKLKRTPIEEQDEDCVSFPLPETFDRFIIENTVDCSRFLERFMEIYREMGDVEDIENVQLVIATRDKAFCTMGEANTYEVEDFWAIGSGGPYSIGFLESVYAIPDPFKGSGFFVAQLKRAVETACKYAQGCEPPVEILDVSHLTHK